jgi:hypothetical protein
MSSKRIGHRMLACAGGLALIAMTAACGSGGNQAPSSTTTTTTTTSTTTSSAPPTAPTEKSINPTGGNLFTPPVQAPGVPTVQPGEHPGINGVP